MKDRRREKGAHIAGLGHLRSGCLPWPSSNHPVTQPCPDTTHGQVINAGPLCQVLYWVLYKNIHWVIDYFPRLAITKSPHAEQLTYIVSQFWSCKSEIKVSAGFPLSETQAEFFFALSQFLMGAFDSPCSVACSYISPTFAVFMWPSSCCRDCT